MPDSFLESQGMLALGEFGIDDAAGGVINEGNQDGFAATAFAVRNQWTMQTVSLYAFQRIEKVELQAFFLDLVLQEHAGGLFELSSKDIILFKRHPEAISARNLLACTVVSLFESGSRTGVELAVGQGRLIAEIVPAAAQDLNIVPGSQLYAAIKASAFRKLATAGPGGAQSDSGPVG